MPREIDRCKQPKVNTVTLAGFATAAFMNSDAALNSTRNSTYQQCH